MSKTEQTKFIADAVAEAFQAAKAASMKMVTENPEVWYPCGFAWVKIKPARGPLVKFLKDNKLGRTDDFEGGFVVYNPGGGSTQWMDAKAAGADAFVQVIKNKFPNVRAFTQTRMD